MAIAVQNEGDVAVLRLELGRGNAIDPKFIEALETSLAEVERSRARAAVITGSGKTFCAGLDLGFTSSLNREGMAHFVDAFEAMFLRVFTFPKPLVAAVNGHAIAGGAILALACDLRLFGREGVTFAINEVLLGIPLPAAAFEIARQAVPRPIWAASFLGGKRLTPPELAVSGLGALADQPDIVPEAIELARRLTEGSVEAVASVKADLAAPTIALIATGRAKRRERFLDAWFGDEAARRRAELLTKIRPRG